MIYCQKLNKFYKVTALCISVIVIINFYLIYSFTNETIRIPSIQKEKLVIAEKFLRGNPLEQRELKKKIVNTTLLATHRITDHLNEVKRFFQSFELPLNRKLHSLLNTKNFTSQDIWKIAKKWVNKNEIVPRNAPFLQSVLAHLRKSKIEIADVIPKGSQLKILLTLEGGQRALFKPKWYEVDTVIKGGVYSGYDRHNGEIVSFHLARLLGLNRVPIVTIRTINLDSDIIPVAKKSLKDTFFKEDGATCFYGVCLYCKKENSICGKNGELDGSITLWLPEEMVLKKARHPWQRSYTTKPALWEMHSDYCQDVRNSKQYQDENRLLDLIEISIFDFLIGNGDRHHYEFFNEPQSKVLLIDNAKSFGNPFVDHIDILAPLYQCCRIRKSFLAVMVSFQNGALSLWLKKLLSANGLERILHKDHFTALDRRLNYVLAAVLVCLEQNGSNNVILSG